MSDVTKSLITAPATRKSPGSLFDGDGGMVTVRLEGIFMSIVGGVRRIVGDGSMVTGIATAAISRNRTVMPKGIMPGAQVYSA